MTTGQMLQNPLRSEMSPGPAGIAPRTGARDPNRWWARAVGGMFLGGAAVHLILVSTNSRAYDSFADGSYWPFIAHSWRSVLVPNVYYLIPTLAGFEVMVGVLILSSRQYRRVGIAVAIAFNLALMLFGWGFWVWSIPMVTFLGWFLTRELRGPRLSRDAGDPTRVRYR